MEGLTAMFDVTEFGVIGDGAANNTKAIAQVVAMAEKAGGGTIYFPPGNYVTGTIELKSNITLHLAGGATILGSAEPEDYPMITVRSLEGYAREGHSGLIKALRAKNITISGRGTIDGRGYNWWHQPKNEHRPRAIQPILCEDVRIEGIHIKNSAMWTVHPVCCNNVTIDGITIKNPSNSPNTDGINPESCTNVHISNCTVDVGDDCVTLKSGTQDDLLQKQYPCENIVITNCTMLNGHGGVVIGSEMSGGVKNVTISNCVFNGTDRGIRIKTRRKRGGSVEDVLINNIMMNNVLAPITINGYYQCGAGVNPDDMSLFSQEKLEVTEDTPVIRNITISNVRAKNARASAGYILGIPEMPVRGLRVNHYMVEMLDTGEELRDKPVMAFHVKKTKGEGIFCANIENCSFTDVFVKTVTGSALQLEHAQGVMVNGLSGECEKALIEVRQSASVVVSGCVAGEDLELVCADEESADEISVMGSAKAERQAWMA